MISWSDIPLLHTTLPRYGVLSLLSKQTVPSPLRDDSTSISHSYATGRSSMPLLHGQLPPLPAPAHYQHLIKDNNRNSSYSVFPYFTSSDTQLQPTAMEYRLSLHLLADRIPWQVKNEIGRINSIKNISTQHSGLMNLTQEVRIVTSQKVLSFK